MITRLRQAYALPNRYERLRPRGLITLEEIAERLDVGTATVKIWRRAGLLVGHLYNDKGQYLYEVPGVDAPKKHQHQGKMRGIFAASSPNNT